MFPHCSTVFTSGPIGRAAPRGRVCCVVVLISGQSLCPGGTHFQMVELLPLYMSCAWLGNVCVCRKPYSGGVDVCPRERELVSMRAKPMHVTITHTRKPLVQTKSATSSKHTSVVPSMNTCMCGSMWCLWWYCLHQCEYTSSLWQCSTFLSIGSAQRTHAAPMASAGRTTPVQTPTSNTSLGAMMAHTVMCSRSTRAHLQPDGEQCGV